MIAIKSLVRTLGIKLTDFFIVIYIKARLLIVYVYYNWLVMMKSLPRNDIIYASTVIDGEKKNVLCETITYYNYSCVISCASIQRWFREKYMMNINQLDVIYETPSGCVVKTSFNLNDDEGMYKYIAFDNEHDDLPYGDITLMENISE